jgi:hypothetical protein
VIEVSSLQVTEQVSPSLHLMTETYPVSETLFSGYTEGFKKMYSLFDSQYLWNKETRSLAQRESESYVFEVTTISG